MSLITKNEYLKIEKLSEDTNVKYITFNNVSRDIKSFKKPNFSLQQNQHLIFDREDFEENIIDTFKIREGIETSSFSCKEDTKKQLLKYFQLKPTLNFLTGKVEILEKIKPLLNNNETQSKKFYNNILKRLKYQKLELFEKTDKQREENLVKGLRQRSKNIFNIKKKQKENEEKEGLVPKIKEQTFDLENINF